MKFCERNYNMHKELVPSATTYHSDQALGHGTGIWLGFDRTIGRER
jgi:hypothetical protein